MVPLICKRNCTPNPALLGSLYLSFRSYWDNVAGSTLDAALVNMSHFGLIIVSPHLDLSYPIMPLSSTNRHVELSQLRATTVTAVLSGYVIRNRPTVFVTEMGRRIAL